MKRTTKAGQKAIRDARALGEEIRTANKEFEERTDKLVTSIEADLDSLEEEMGEAEVNIERAGRKAARELHELDRQKDRFEQLIANQDRYEEQLERAEIDVSEAESRYAEISGLLGREAYLPLFGGRYFSLIAVFIVIGLVLNWRFFAFREPESVILDGLLTIAVAVSVPIAANFAGASFRQVGSRPKSAISLFLALFSMAAGMWAIASLSMNPSASAPVMAQSFERAFESQFLLVGSNTLIFLAVGLASVFAHEKIWSLDQTYRLRYHRTRVRDRTRIMLDSTEAQLDKMSRERP